MAQPLYIYLSWYLDTLSNAYYDFAQQSIMYLYRDICVDKYNIILTLEGVK